ncbi:hypothetical protein JW899_04125 [Candidatus Uhrbacteria bacterium]|nr:hypothetical protein [Candidatus Uhrbacteria bacterium]
MGKTVRKNNYVEFALSLLFGVVFLHVLIFAVNIFIHPPHWLPGYRVGGLSAALGRDHLYRAQVAKIFYLAGAVSLISFCYLRFVRRIRCFIVEALASLAVFAALFAFLSTRGHQWYFPFSSSGAWQWFESLSVVAILLAVVAFGTVFCLRGIRR